jgi:hypothetical protein
LRAPSTDELIFLTTQGFDEANAALDRLERDEPEAYRNLMRKRQG